MMRNEPDPRHREHHHPTPITSRKPGSRPRSSPDARDPEPDVLRAQTHTCLLLQ
jgi:hypothetical protein